MPSISVVAHVGFLRVVLLLKCLLLPVSSVALFSFSFSCRMSFAFFVNESNIWTLSTMNPFVFAIFYHFSRKYSMMFINYFHLLCLILLSFEVFPFRHYLGLNIFKFSFLTNKTSCNCFVVSVN